MEVPIHLMVMLSPRLGATIYMLSLCPQTLHRGLPSFQLWVTCSGGRQSMLVTMHIFGIIIIAVKRVQLCSGENRTVWNTGELHPSPYLIFVISKMEAVRQVHSPLSKMTGGTSLVVQGLRSHFPMQVVQVQSLLGELRSHMPLGQKKKKP